MSARLGIVGGLVAGIASGAVGAKFLISSTPADLFGNQKTPVIEIDGTQYGESDLPTNVQSQFFDVRFEAFDRLFADLSNSGLQMLLAKDKGVAWEERLPSFESLVALPEPTGLDLEVLYEQYRSQLPEGSTFQSVRPDLVQFAKMNKLKEELRKWAREVQKSRRMKVVMLPPLAPQVDMDLSDYASIGSKESATLVGVTDYLCKVCESLYSQVKALREEPTGKDIRIVQVPVSLHPDALSGSLVQGAYCAKQQGDEAFWKYHDNAFAVGIRNQWKSEDLASTAAVLEVAKEAAIDAGKVEVCLAAPETAAFMKTTAAKFAAVGLTNTPTFFFMNRKIAIKTTLKLALQTIRLPE